MFSKLIIVVINIDRRKGLTFALELFQLHDVRKIFCSNDFWPWSLSWLLTLARGCTQRQTLPNGPPRQRRPTRWSSRSPERTAHASSPVGHPPKMAFRPEQTGGAASRWCWGN